MLCVASPKTGWTPAFIVRSEARALLPEARVTVAHHALQLVSVIKNAANQLKKLDDDHCGLLFEAGARGAVRLRDARSPTMLFLA